MRCNFLLLDRLYFSHSALVACGAAEMSGQKGLDQFPGERRPDHFSSQTKDIHVVIFDALVGGENIMNKPSTHTMDFVRGDGCTLAAAAKRDSALTFPAATALAKGIMKSG